MQWYLIVLLLPLNGKPQMFEFEVRNEAVCIEAGREVQKGLDRENHLYEGYSILCEGRPVETGLPLQEI